MDCSSRGCLKGIFAKGMATHLQGLQTGLCGGPKEMLLIVFIGLSRARLALIGMRLKRKELAGMLDEDV